MLPAGFLLAIPIMQGCSLIGLGVGDAVPKYEPVTPPYRSLSRGNALRVEATSAGTEGTVKGAYDGMSNGILTIETADGERSLPQKDIAQLEQQVGTYWLTGLITGAVVDLTVVTLVGLAVWSMEHSHWNVQVFQGPL